MKLSVQIDSQYFLVTPRTGEKYIFRAILGAVVDAGEARKLGEQAQHAARALSSGLDGYHWAGPPEFRVLLLDA